MPQPAIITGSFNLLCSTNVLKLHSKIVQGLFIKAFWWELMVAKQITNARNCKELF